MTNSHAAPARFSPSKQLLFASACGVLVANLYYAQPLVALIAPDLGIGEHAAGAVVTTAQLGYAGSLLFVTPAADIVESRKLIFGLLILTVLALVGAAFATSSTGFLLCSFLIGVGSTAAQVLVPLTAHFAPPETRGRVIGNVVAGLLAGIMLARPLASIVAAHGGWRAIFGLSAILTAGIGACLFWALPGRRPVPGLGYRAMLASVGRLFAVHPILRRRTACHTLAFASFQLFWTGVPLVLAERYGLSQSGIALFALAGAGGALAAPLAGRMADRGVVHTALLAVIGLLVASFALAGFSAAALSLAGLLVAAVLIDAAVQTNLVFSQRAIFGLDRDAQARINAGFMFSIFLGGAAGSFLGAFLYALGGWTADAAAGAGLGLLALAVVFWEGRAPRTT